MVATDTTSTSAPGEPLPVRMLNEFAYCPRLFHLMHVERRWADNQYTAEGKEAHRRVDQLDHVLPDPQKAKGETATEDGASPPKNKAKSAADDGQDPPEITRSVPLASDRLGLTAKLDLVSTASDEAVPVETKRGKVPRNEQRSYEPERVQLMAQGLLLREHGYRCDHGVLYFHGSRTRVDVPFDEDLEARTLHLIEQAHQAGQRTHLPEPLEDSPKCHGCSLAGICLPDETLALKEVPADETAPSIRRLYPARDNALPLYVQEQGAKVGKTKQALKVEKSGEELTRVPIKDVSQLVLCGNITVSAQTMHLLCEAGVPVVHLSRGHYFYGITSGITLRNAYARAAQYQAATDPHRCLRFAKQLSSAKVANQRTLLRRNGGVADRVLRDLADYQPRIQQCESLDALLGLEGGAASHYFSHFSSMLRPRDFDSSFDVSARNRRPPRDPVNAMLSFGYALLSKECTVALMEEGLDPWWGLFHQPRHGRPALALDLMEEFRPLVVDSAVVTAINTGMVSASHFTQAASGCLLKPEGRKAFIRAYEARLDQLVTHPVFDYRCAYRSLLRLQGRLLGRYLRGDVSYYVGMTSR